MKYTFTTRELDRWTISFSEGPLRDVYYRRATPTEALRSGIQAGTLNTVLKYLEPLEDSGVSTDRLRRHNLSVINDLNKILELVSRPHLYDKNQKRIVARENAFLQRTKDLGFPLSRDARQRAKELVLLISNPNNLQDICFALSVSYYKNADIVLKDAANNYNICDKKCCKSRKSFK